MSSPLKFCDLGTYAVKIFPPGLVCGSCQFVCQSSLILPSFIVNILPCPSSILLVIFLCNLWLHCSPLDFPNQITHSIYLTFLDFSSALQYSHFHIQLHQVFLLKYFALSVIERTTSPTLLGFHFWNHMICFSLVQILATSKWHSVNICSKKCLHSLHTVSESLFHKYIVSWEHNIKMDLKEIGWEWIHLAQDRDQCQAVLNTSFIKCREFLD
jgi:hypothetical protein